MKIAKLCIALVATCAAFLPLCASAAPLTPGNVLVYATAAKAASGIGTAIDLLEYSPDGTLVQTINLPSSGSNAIVYPYTSNNINVMQPSVDGHYVTFVGYRADAGTAIPLTSDSSARVVGLIDANGNLDTSTSIPFGPAGGTATSIQSAATVDGKEFWVGGSAGNIDYVSSVGAHSSTRLITGGLRFVKAYNSGPGSASQFAGTQLYWADKTIVGPAPFFGGASPGALPTDSPASSQVITTGFGPTINTDFTVLDTDHNGILDTLYYTDLGQSPSGIAKYYWDGTNWTLKGHFNAFLTGAPNGMVGKFLTGSVEDNGNVDLYVVGGGLSGTGTIQGWLFHVVDSTGIGGDISSGVNISGSPIAFAEDFSSSERFYSVSVVPTAVPEPSTIVLGALGVCGFFGVAHRSARALKLAKLSVALTAMCVVLMPLAAGASPLTPGDLLIYASTPGDGAINVRQPVTLLEYSPSGLLVQSIPLPSSGANSLTNTPNTINRSDMSLSADGRYVTFVGRRDTSFGTTSDALTNVIGRIDADGNVDTSTSIPFGPAGGTALQATSAVTYDGNEFWVTGQNGTGAGLEYVGSLGAHTAIQLASPSQQLSRLKIFSSGPGSPVQFSGPQLYGLTSQVLTFTGSSPFLGGTSPGPLPTSGSATSNLLINTALARSEHALDTDGNSILDTMYIGDGNLNGISKYFWDGSAWVNKGNYIPPDINGLSINPITASVRPDGTVDIYGIALGAAGAGLPGQGVLYHFADGTGTGGSITGSPLVTSQQLAFASDYESSTRFWGVSFVPMAVPEPPTLVLGAIALVGLLVVARRPWLRYAGCAIGTGTKIFLAAGIICLCYCSLLQATPIVSITEFNSATGAGSENFEYVEFTNTSGAPVDMTGWSEDDSSATPNKSNHSLSGFGILAPGESAIFTEAAPDNFRTYWWGSVGAAPAGLKIIGGYTNDNLNSTEDGITLFDNTSTLVDRLDYPGSPAFPGGPTPGAGAGVSRNPLAKSVLGLNQNYNWVNSALGDSYGSFAAAGRSSLFGNPGIFTAPDNLPPPPPSHAYAKIVEGGEGGDDAPGFNGDLFYSFLPSTFSANGSGQVTFSSTLTSHGDPQHTVGTGIFAGTPGALTLVYFTGTQGPGNQAPGLPAGTTIGNLSNPVIDSAGHVAFTGTLSGSGVTTSNDTSLWMGAPGAISVVIREGDQAPGLDSGVTFTGDFKSLDQGGFKISKTGSVAFPATVAGPNITASNNTGIWVGAPGSLGLLARSGDAAPGTVGAHFNGLALASYSIGSGGHVAFSNSIAGGDVVGATNRSGIWVGKPGNLSLLVRQGDQPAGLPAGVKYSTFSSTLNVNSTGQVAFNSLLLQTGGVNGTNDSGLWAGAPGSVGLLGREGDIAPGTGGALFGDFANVNKLLADDGRVFFVNSLTGTGVTSANNSGLWFGQPGNVQLLERIGDLAPGGSSGETITGLTVPIANALGQIAFQVSTSLGSAIYAGTPDDLHLVLHSGDYIDLNPDPRITDLRQVSTVSISTFSLSDTGLLTISSGGIYQQLAVPEPSTFALSGLGMIGFVGMVGSRKRI